MQQGDFNVFNILQMIRGGANPQQLVMQYLEQGFGDTPMGQNLLGLAQQGRTGDIEQIARNICQQKGIDFDKEFNAFKNQLNF